MRSPRPWPRAFLSFYFLSIADGGELTCQLYFLLFEGVRWFWGLTCDFSAKNAKNKCNGKNTGNRSVASPFGLRSGPSAERWPLRGWLDAGLKPRSISMAKAEGLRKATASSKAKATARAKAKAKARAKAKAKARAKAKAKARAKEKAKARAKAKANAM